MEGVPHEKGIEVEGGAGGEDVVEDGGNDSSRASPQRRRCDEAAFFTFQNNECRDGHGRAAHEGHMTLERGNQGLWRLVYL